MVWLQGSYPPSFEALLRTVVFESRPTHGRLNWNPYYAPYRPEPLGATAVPALKRYPEILAASGKVALRAESQGSAGDLRTLGVFDLFDGRPDRAVTALEEAASLSPLDASLLSDLALARLARAEREERGYELLPALAAVDRAVTLDPSSPEARFNRALILEALGLLEHARAAWEDYLRLDSTSRWAEEARARHDALGIATRREQWEQSRSRLDKAAADGDEAVVAELVARFPEQARVHSEEELLAEWGQAWRRGDAAGAGAWLRIARRIAEELTRRGEYLPVRAVAAVERVAGDPNRAATAAAGHLAYLQARKLYLKGRSAEACAPFGLAERALRRVGSPVAGLATLYNAPCRGEKSIGGTLDALLRQPELVDYPGLRGRALRNRGLWERQDGNPAAALTYYESARAIFESHGYHEETDLVDGLLADNLRYLGEWRRAWAPLLRSVHASRVAGIFMFIRVTFNEAANACLEMGWPGVARYYRDEVLHVRAESGEPMTRAEALVRHAEALQRLGDLRTATEDLATARGLLKRIRDDDERDRSKPIC